MRKIILLSVIAIFLFVVIILTLPAIDTSPPAEDGDNWSRHDAPCPNLPKEKTNCISGGNEQCTAQYCN